MSEVGVSAPGPITRVRPGRSTNWWGMIALMTTEGMLFVLLFFVYFYYRAQPGGWPPGAIPLPALQSSAVRTVILLGSSLPMVLAERALEEHGDAVKSAAWQFIALAMGAVFLLGHIQEQYVLFAELSPTETVYGSVFMTILNFHIAHLIVGMIILAFVALQTVRGRITPQRSTQLQMGGLYWHYVDVIWVFVYSILYLSPHVFA